MRTSRISWACRAWALAGLTEAGQFMQAASKACRACTRRIGTRRNRFRGKPALQQQNEIAEPQGVPYNLNNVYQIPISTAYPTGGKLPANVCPANAFVQCLAPFFPLLPADAGMQEQDHRVLLDALRRTYHLDQNLRDDRGKVSFDVARALDLVQEGETYNGRGQFRMDYPEGVAATLLNRYPFVANLFLAAGEVDPNHGYRGLSGLEGGELIFGDGTMIYRGGAPLEDQLNADTAFPNKLPRRSCSCATKELPRVLMTSVAQDHSDPVAMEFPREMTLKNARYRLRSAVVRNKTFGTYASHYVALRMVQDVLYLCNDLEGVDENDQVPPDFRPAACLTEEQWRQRAQGDKDLGHTPDFRQTYCDGRPMNFGDLLAFNALVVFYERASVP